MRSRLLVATAICVLVCATASSSLRAAPQPQETTDYAAHFNQGNELIKQLKFHEAVTEFREAIRLNSGYLPAHQALVVAYAFTERFDLSWMEVAYVRAAGAEVSDAFLRKLTMEMSETDASSKRATNAQELADAKEAIVGQDKNAGARARLSRALADSGDFPAAQDEAIAALEINSAEPQAHLVLASLLIPDPPLEEQALPHLKLYLRNAARTASDLSDLDFAYEWLSEIYFQRGMDSEALAALQEGMQADPQDARLLNRGAWIYVTATEETLRDPKQAMSLAQKAVEISKEKRPTYLDTLGQSAYANGSFDQAIAAEKKAIALLPDNQFYRDQLKKFQAAKAKAKSKKP